MRRNILFFGVVSSLLVILIAVFFIGVRVGKTSVHLPEQAQENDGNELESLQRELMYCLDDQAQSKSLSEEAYSLEAFRIFSPLFPGTTAEHQTFLYKQNAIEKRTISLPFSGESVPARVVTWKLQSGRYLPDLPQRLWVKREPTDLSFPLVDFPVFDGYEFQTYVSREKFVSARIPENPTPADTYRSARGITMYRSRLSCPKSYCGAELHFLTTVDDGKTQLFVQLSAEVNTLSIDLSEIEPAIQQRFADLERIADTFDFQAY